MLLVRLDLSRAKIPQFSAAAQVKLVFLTVDPWNHFVLSLRLFAPEPIWDHPPALRARETKFAQSSLYAR